MENSKIIPELAKKYTVIAPDMRGFGDSEKPPDGYDGLSLANDFRELIHSLDFDDIHIIAHDMGGSGSAPVRYAVSR